MPRVARAINKTVFIKKSVLLKHKKSVHEINFLPDMYLYFNIM